MEVKPLAPLGKMYDDIVRLPEGNSGLITYMTFFKL